MVVKIWKSLVLLDSWFDPCHPHHKWSCTGDGTGPFYLPGLFLLCVYSLADKMYHMVNKVILRTGADHGGL